MNHRQYLHFGAIPPGLPGKLDERRVTLWGEPSIADLVHLVHVSGSRPPMIGEATGEPSRIALWVRLELLVSRGLTARMTRELKASSIAAHSFKMKGGGVT